MARTDNLGFIDRLAPYWARYFFDMSLVPFMCLRRSVGRLVEPRHPDVRAADGSVSFYLGGREELPERGVKVSAAESAHGAFD